MASKRKVNQDDLRKMMAKVKSGPRAASGNAASVSKRYKLSSRELILMEEQKKQQEGRRQMKEAQLKASQAKLPPAPPPDAKPQKSILKNKAAYQPPIVLPSCISISPTHNKPDLSLPQSEDTLKIDLVSNDASSNTDRLKEKVENLKPSVDERAREGTSFAETIENNVQGDTKEPAVRDSDLPEGFFDDPIQDAKARHVPYINAEEEEWERFQKEIGEEMSTAQSILVEDREEATADRQIEEIDEQMEAWSRVSRMEQKKDQVHVRNLAEKKSIVKSKGANLEDSDSNEDENFEEFMSWRKKR